MSKLKKTTLWILTIFFFSGFFTFLPSISCIFFFVLGLLCLPITKWQNLIGSFIKGKLKSIIAVILAIFAIGTAPENTASDTENVNTDEAVIESASETLDLSFISTSEEITDSPSKDNHDSTPAEESTPHESNNVTTSETDEPTEDTTEKVTESVTEETTEKVTEVTTEATTTPHVHSFVPPSCTSPKKCSDCGYSDGNATGHKWTNATCTSAKKCTVCGISEGNATGHKWTNATCTSAKKCTVCGISEGNATGHNWTNATCTSPKKCAVCGISEGNATGHNWTNATCTSAKKCTVCGISEGNAMGHNWTNATYSSPKTCTSCGITEGSAKEVPGSANYHGHVYTGGEYSVKYHYESECAGKNSHEITWNEVDSRGLGPCGTCVLK